MSTRAQVAFYGNIEQPLKKWDALIYKHSDGYPEGVLPELEVFATDFNAKRGLSDSEYASAWYLMFLYKQHMKMAEDWSKDHAKEIADPSRAFPELKDFGLYSGNGVSKQIHGDIEYFYAVYPNRIEAYDLSWDDQAFGLGSNTRTMEGFTMTLMETIQIK
jgi:hypothetical protein